jgi:ribosomal protein S18 acetylase RimI-like enzyme
MIHEEPAVRVRAAVSADVPALAHVQLRAALIGFAHIFPELVPKPTQGELEDEWAPLMSDPSKTVLAAISEDVVVAGVAFGDYPGLAPAGWGHLAKLYVMPEASGNGIGATLHDIAVGRLRAAGYRDLWLWVLEANARARGMYERRGWMAQSERRTDWPDSGVFEMGYALQLPQSS